MVPLRRSYIASFLLASSVALGLAPAAQAHGEPMQGRMGMHRGAPMMMLRGLDLSDAQRDQVFKIFHEQAPAVHEQMKQVRQAADAQAKALSTLAVMHAQTVHRVRDVLTPEQRARMDQMAQRRRGQGPR